MMAAVSESRPLVQQSPYIAEPGGHITGLDGTPFYYTASASPQQTYAVAHAAAAHDCMLCMTCYPCRKDCGGFLLGGARDLVSIFQEDCSCCCSCLPKCIAKCAVLALPLIILGGQAIIASNSSKTGAITASVVGNVMQGVYLVSSCFLHRLKADCTWGQGRLTSMMMCVSILSIIVSVPVTGFTLK